MLHEYYIYSIQAVASMAFLTMIAYLFGSRSRDRLPVGRGYVRSRRWMAGAMLLVSCLMLVHLHYQLRVYDNLAGAAVSLTFYYAASHTIGLSLISLCNAEYDNPRRIWIGVSKSLAFVTVLAIAYHFMPRVVFLVLVLCGSVLFLYDTSMKGLTFHRYYKKLKEDLSNYYSENYEGYTRWMSRATIYWGVMGMAAPFVMLAPMQYILVFNILLAFLIFYVFVSYERYIVYDRYCVQAHPELDGEAQAPLEECSPQVESEAEAYDIDELIREGLEHWIAEKKYCMQDINIVDLSRSIGTNRTYLSRYINTTYNLSFRNWIASLRIEEAKRLLSEGDVNLTELSEQLGFPNLPAFSRTFSQLVGDTPSNYRKRR